jgi:plasmid stabilization system protein ParE
MKIISSAQSQRDLRDIRKFIARDAPETASAYIRRLKLAVRRLRSFPYTGSVVRELVNPAIREVYFGQYRLIYEIASDRVEILTVFHGARLLDETQF